MITQALQHCEGIGPIRLAELHDAGVRSWHDVLDAPHRIPTGWRANVVSECCRCVDALQSRDLHYFAERLLPEDKWRLLDHCFDDASYFDIETTGLEYDAQVTVIICWHRGELHTFVEGDNLDDFLDLLDDMTLLVSFNGASFDVPRVLDTFHIPDLPCPHLDLRWISYHRDLSGSLKEITHHLDLPRPVDLHDADGALAVEWWHQWMHSQNQAARQQLIRYCAADVLMLVALAHYVTDRDTPPADELWSALPPAPVSEVPAPRLLASRRARGRLLRLFHE